MKLLVHNPLCCELTNLYFCKLLAQIARAKGFNVVRWPVNGRADWMAVGQAARDGRMAPGAAAVMLHSWHGDYDKECVPSWDYYPVLEAVKACQELLYPSAPLDELHSEKKYRSELLPPTVFINFVRSSSHCTGWEIEDAGDKELDQYLQDAVCDLEKEAAAAGLQLSDVMVKQGLSWGGQDVSRLAPTATAIHKHLRQRVLPKVPPQAHKLTILLQAKIDLVAELRWVILDGKLRGRGWRTFQQAARGKTMTTGGMAGEIESREALKAAGLIQDEEDLRRLEESLRGKVEHVLAEATRDANGEVPQFLRVDLLLDKHGRAWLGERESWGADLVKSTLNENTGNFTRQDPCKNEVASAMVSRALRMLCLQPSVPTKHSMSNGRTTYSKNAKVLRLPRKTIAKKVISNVAGT